MVNLRIPLLVSIAVAVTTGLPACRAAKAQGKLPKPNIILIMADDLGWMDLHCYGNERLDTPALDQLAAEGMRFTDAYAAAPVCSPTRAAIMTGQTPGRLRLTNHAPGHQDGFALEGSNLKEAESVRHLALSYVTIAERLSKAGYVTAHMGKWHLSYVARNNQDGIAEPDLRPDKQGFDINIGGCFRGGPPSYFAPYRIPTLVAKQEGEYLPERLADEAIKFVQENRDRPFFLNWWPYSVHYPMQARDELIAKYRQRRGPGIKDPVYAAMIEGMDCYPTLLEVAGLAPTPVHPIDGKNLVPLFKQSSGFERDAIYFHYPNYAFHKQNRLGSAIREGEYKLIKRYRDGELELFDLSKDLGEKTNLAREKAELAKRLEGKLDVWLRETGANFPTRGSG